MSEEDPKDADATPPKEMPEELKKDTVVSAPKLAIFTDPADFEIGVTNNFGDPSPVIVFLKDGEPAYGVVFTEQAAEKALVSFMGMLALLYGTAGEEESPRFAVPENKKKPTLH